VAHAATVARLDTTHRQCVALEAELGQARRAIDEARARADMAIEAADEPAQGAERCAALKLERERQLRSKAEKSSESIAKRFEEALRVQIAASEKLVSVEARLAQLKADSHKQELRLQELLDGRDARVRVL